LITQTLAAERSGKQDSLTKRYFTLSSVPDLKAFYNDLDPSDPFSAALAFLITSWFPLLPADDAVHFEPGSFVADDLSAAMLGPCPVVFMGSNDWATKPFFSLEAHINKSEVYIKHLHKLTTIFPGKTIVLVVVPEKDYVIDKQFLGTDRFTAIDTAMEWLAKACRKDGVAFLFSEYLEPMKRYDTLSEFEYFDTHLSSRHYIQIFARILKALGFAWADIATHFTIIDDQRCGDLSTKFGPRRPSPRRSRIPYSKVSDCRLTAGTTSFAEPLGATWQNIANAHPLKAGKVLLLGDSHSSILTQNRLTYLLASTFEQCDFFWNPFGVREAPVATDADIVVMEISQRFLF
jgi:hypothetical protein